MTHPFCCGGGDPTSPVQLTSVPTRPACGAELRPLPGDCCVFCSYGSVPCPPVQRLRGIKPGAAPPA
ncbi:MAG: GDCCVxC domain-containing (seleno)protein [Thiomonas sp.]|uniref:GDCCVxC domain-containing (seleno)protein n=1 Tax=Thiomonas sp. TaxID=2047785 RepID=UPI002A35E02C|nr:GDCCVxC domain-containing (seleno)protein [Thiomonas sp.]MDY0329290.1 GDCCVxC domain-containing (seleno)protein [Thiomonas sp.]